jgi:hypothetical protein
VITGGGQTRERQAHAQEDRPTTAVQAHPLLGDHAVACDLDRDAGVAVLSITSDPAPSQRCMSPIGGRHAPRVATDVTGRHPTPWEPDVGLRLPTAMCPRGGSAISLAPRAQSVKGRARKKPT